MYLSKDDIIKAKDLPRLAVEVPEWGGTVLIARLPSTIRVSYQTWCLTLPEGSFEHVSRLLALTLIDIDGQRLFSDGEEVLLGDKSLNAIFPLFQAAMQHNLIGDREVSRIQGESEPSRSSDTA